MTSSFEAITHDEALERGKELYAELNIGKDPYKDPEQLLRDFAQSNGIDYSDYIEVVNTDEDRNEILEGFKDFKTELEQLDRVFLR